MTAFAADDLTDFGTDIGVVSDLAPVWGLAVGQANLINALLRRLITPRGGLFYDPDYGFDVVALVNAAITQTDIARIKAGVAAEFRKDQRVQGVTVDAVFTFATKTLQLTIKVTTASGPFDLVLAASGVTVDLLSVNGIPVPAATTTNISVIVGAPGPMGPAGPAGTSSGGGGSGNPSLTMDDPQLLGSSSGSEDVLFQWSADFGALAVGSLTAEVAASVFSGAGTATFRLRVGGSDGVADGTVVATITHAVAAFQIKSGSGTFANPTGVLPVKLTAQSSGAAVDAQVTGPVVTIR